MSRRWTTSRVLITPEPTDLMLVADMSEPEGTRDTVASIELIGQVAVGSHAAATTAHGSVGAVVGVDSSITLDPVAAPTGNVGGLRALLGWLANRIRAATGATNWWDAPATTLAAAHSHHGRLDNPHAVTAAQAGAETPAGAQTRVDAHAAVTDAHAATAAPTASRIVLRDADGRAQVAVPSAAADIARLDTVTAHTTRTDNPHVVTAAQAGATPAAHETATAVHRIFVSSDGVVGIGTSTPAARLHVGGSILAGLPGIVGRVTMDFQTDTNWSDGLTVRKRGTTGDMNAAVASGAEIGYHSFFGWDGGAFKRLAFVLVSANQATTPTSGGGNYSIVTRDPGTNAEVPRLTIRADGNVGIGAVTPTARLDVDANTIRLRVARTPASATATGAIGEICWDAGFVYVCVAANTWHRAALAAW